MLALSKYACRYTISRPSPAPRCRKHPAQRIVWPSVGHQHIAVGRLPTIEAGSNVRHDVVAMRTALRVPSAKRAELAQW